MPKSFLIRQTNPRANYIAHQKEIDSAIARVMESGWYILGQEVTAFEQEFAAYIGVEFGIGVGSGTEALHIALRACEVKPGDEVITVSHTAVATVAAIQLCGAKPVLVDIHPDTFVIDANQIERAITSRTRAIIPVHLYGYMADMQIIRSIADRHGVRVVEDCAQSHGAAFGGRKSGAWGDMATFSFYPTKNLGALGDAGMIVTHDPKLGERARLLREYGWRQRYVSEIPGLNSRLDELQAAILRVKLRYLDQWNEERRRKAKIYTEMLTPLGIGCPSEGSGIKHVYHLYVIRTRKRDMLRALLKEKGIETLVHYPVPIHLQKAYEDLGYRKGDLPLTEQCCSEILSLPFFPEMKESEMRIVAQEIRSFFEKNGANDTE